MDGLSAEDRAFLNETMEVRNDILKKSKLASPTSTHEDEEDKNEIKLKTPRETLKETAKVYKKNKVAKLLLTILFFIRNQKSYKKHQ